MLSKYGQHVASKMLSRCGEDTVKMIHLPIKVEDTRHHEQAHRGEPSRKPCHETRHVQHAGNAAGGGGGRSKRGARFIWVMGGSYEDTAAREEADTRGVTQIGNEWEDAGIVRRQDAGKLQYRQGRGWNTISLVGT